MPRQLNRLVNNFTKLFLFFIVPLHAMEPMIYERVQGEDIEPAISFMIDTMEQSHSVFLSDNEMERDIELKKTIIKERLRNAAFEDDKYFGIAKDDDAIIGAIAARLTENTMFIDFLYIDKNYRSKGIGPQLAKKCLLDLYKSQRFSKVGLQVYEKNERAVAKYLKEGFKEISKKDKDGTISLVMERTITFWEKCGLNFKKLFAK